MRKYGIPLSIVFLLLTGCIGIHFPDTVWVPKSVPVMQGEDHEMGGIANRCNNGYYTGFSTQNLDKRMSQRCEHIDNDNTICSVKAIDRRRHYQYREVYDPNTKKSHYENVLITDYDHYVINMYINEKGLVSDCKAEEGHFALFFDPTPAPGTLSSKLSME